MTAPAPQCQPSTALLPCPFCKKPPGSKVGPPAMARCITPDCEGTKLAAYTFAEWNTHAAPPSTETPRHTSSGSDGPSSSEIETMWRVFNAAYDTVSQTEPGKARRAGFDAVVSHLFPYVDAFRREEARADKLGAELDELRGGAQGAPDQRLTEDMTLAHNARKTAIEECARELETSYPDHAWLNAACAAIRALSAVTPSPGSGEPDSAFMMQEVLDFLNSIEGAGYGGMASFEIVRGYVRDLAVPSTPRCTCQPLTRYAGDEHDPDCAMTSTQSGGAAK